MSPRAPAPSRSSPRASAPGREAGQAAVETALTLPMMLFAALGILQLTLAYHARILTEYAAFKVARAGSVYRADCTRMQRAALMALIPSMPVVEGSPEDQFVATARRITRFPGFNRSHKRTPLVFIDYRLENYDADRPFDAQLEPGATDVMRLRIKLAYFFEYRIPFANWIMTRYWITVRTGRSWAVGADPTMVARDAKNPLGLGFSTDELVTQSMLAIERGYFTTPLVTSWSMRMMSDPLPGASKEGQCR